MTKDEQILLLTRDNDTLLRERDEARRQLREAREEIRLLRAELPGPPTAASLN